MTPSSDSSVTRCETCGHDHVCQHGYAANLGPDVWCCECDAGDDPFIALHPFVPAPAPSTDLASEEPWERRMGRAAYAYEAKYPRKDSPARRHGFAEGARWAVEEARKSR